MIKEIIDIEVLTQSIITQSGPNAQDRTSARTIGYSDAPVAQTPHIFVIDLNYLH